MWRVYLHEWMATGWGPEAEVTRLGETVELLVSRETIADWLEDALQIGIDPL